MNSRGTSVLDKIKRLVTGAESREAITGLRKEVQSLRREVAGVRRELHDRLIQYHLQLGRFARATNGQRRRRVSLSRAVPIDINQPAAQWQPVGDQSPSPDPGGQEWMILDRCPVCDGPDRTVVVEWNKLLLMAKAPDEGAARYDYAVCHSCGVLYATRRPTGARYRYLLEHFGETTGKRDGIREISSVLLNPYPLTEADRQRLRRLISRGAFVSDHLGLKRSDYMQALLADRFGHAAHIDIISSLLEPRDARVLEIRSKTGAILDGLRRLFNAKVYAMPIWESQRLILSEMYGIETAAAIDFDHFSIPFDAPFDLIICNHMLTHAIRPREFFAAIHRHLSPGAHIYLHNEPDDREFLKGSQSAIAHLNPLHLQAFDQPSLVRALAANGFQVVFVKSWELKHICLARKTEATDVAMARVERSKRIAAYENARDRSILVMPEEFRGRVSDRWSDTVARAVASGEAEFDEGGQLRIVRRKMSSTSETDYEPRATSISTSSRNVDN